MNLNPFSSNKPIVSNEPNEWVYTDEIITPNILNTFNNKLVEIKIFARGEIVYFGILNVNGKNISLKTNLKYENVKNNGNFILENIDIKKIMKIKTIDLNPQNTTNLFGLIKLNYKRKDIIPILTKFLNKNVEIKYYNINDIHQIAYDNDLKVIYGEIIEMNCNDTDEDYYNNDYFYDCVIKLKDVDKNIIEIKASLIINIKEVVIKGNIHTINEEGEGNIENEGGKRRKSIKQKNKKRKTKKTRKNKKTYKSKK